MYKTVVDADSHFAPSVSVANFTVAPNSLPDSLRLFVLDSLLNVFRNTSNSSQDDDSDWTKNLTIEEYDFANHNRFNDTYGENTLYEVPTSIIVVLSCLYGSISVLAVVGNFLVMWVVGTSRRMQSVTNCYIANLALADIVIGLFAVPFQFQAALLQRWLLPHFMCPFCPFVQALSVNVSVFTLTAIAVDRHRAIITPLSAHTSKRVAKWIIVFIWVLALSLAAPMAMSWEVIMADEYDPERDPDLREISYLFSRTNIPVTNVFRATEPVRHVEINTERSFPVTNIFYKKPFCAPSEFGSHSLAIYRLLLYVFQYVIPLCVITFAYAHMAMKLWGARAPGNAQESRDANQMKNKKKVIKMLVIVVALFALCWLPLQSYLLLQSFFSSINETRIMSVRSTNGRSVYSSRKFNNVDSERTRSKAGCQCHRSRDRDKTEDNNFRLIKNFNSILNNKDFNHIANTYSADRRLGSVETLPPMPRLSTGSRVYYEEEDETLPVGDEKITEMYIFPKSDIVEFTDVPYDEKV
ncbi:RYamide receptor [Eumeta japonica]|uniref:RYamide receptor n=1 Tax=Eumeta variegata TaxID=151549 RepID=A0A4C1TJA3_EUMVA|nr:RYamide receptor [Eumeta japonica]